MHDAAEESRPGFSCCAAHEYRDTPSVLAEKVGRLSVVDSLLLVFSCRSFRSNRIDETDRS